MKKLLSTLTLLFASVLLFAQMEINVPQAVYQAFKDGHPTHDFITWSMEGQNYKANSIDQQKMPNVTVYDANGNLIRSEGEMAAKDVPSSIIGFLNEKYPTDANFKVWWVEDKEGNRTYYSNHNDVKIEFKKDGTVNRN